MTQLCGRGSSAGFGKATAGTWSLEKIWPNSESLEREGQYTMDKVIFTPELLEPILLSLPRPSLLQAQRVSRQLKMPSTPLHASSRPYTSSHAFVCSTSLYPIRHHQRQEPSPWHFSDHLLPSITPAATILSQARRSPMLNPSSLPDSRTDSILMISPAAACPTPATAPPSPALGLVSLA